MTWKVSVHLRQDWNDMRTFYIRASNATTAIIRALKAARPLYDKGSSVYVGSVYLKDATIIA